MSATVIAGRYQIVRQVGQGGMGTVYEALHLATGRRVALKLISGDAAEAGPEAVARFQREARMAGSIESRHVVQVLDAGIDEQSGTPYMAMEMLSGVDVRSVLETRGPLPIDTALRIAVQACAGLQRAHLAGITHRDVKSGNLFLARGEPGEVIVKVLDFGLAKLRPLAGAEQGASLSLTRSGTIMGSPLYMSPEQAAGTREPDARSDIWSLGAVMYEMLCGRPPHAEHPTLNSLIVAICTQPVRPIPELAPWVPAPIDAIVRRALAIQPEHRFSNMAEMRAVLEAFLPSGASLDEGVFSGAAPAFLAAPAGTGGSTAIAPSMAMPMVSVTPVPAPGGPPFPSSGTIDAWQPSIAQSAPRAPDRRSRGPLVAAIVAVVSVGAAAAGAFVLRRHSPVPESATAPPATSPNASQQALPTATATTTTPEVTVEGQTSDPPPPAVATRATPHAKGSAVPRGTVGATGTAPNPASPGPIATAITHASPFSKSGGCPQNSAVCMQECQDGDAASCFTYGSIEEKGEYGRPPDYVEALSYYRRACLGSDAQGCAAKARLEAAKPSNAAHDQWVFDWWRHKCEGAQIDGCSMVAMFYERGSNGAPKSIPLAIQALQHGCDGGSQVDCSELKALQARAASP